MSRFLLGDQLGSIKVLRYSPKQNGIDIKTVYHQENTPASSIECLAVNSNSFNDQSTLAAAFSDGSLLLSVLKEDDSFEVLAGWNEPHKLAENKFIGLSMDDSAVFSCTSNGILRKASCNTGSDSSLQPVHSTSLPSRLCDWRMSDNGETFAYGGDEVDLSVWSAELAWQCQPPSGTLPGSCKKRKRNDDLFPAELWRARNIPNDNLGLRQPVRITSLTYLSPSSSGHHLLTGTQFGDLRRYDTRAARRPVSNWEGVGRVGGVRLVKKGLSENELFVGDNGSNLFSIDLRTGGILYSYKGMSGAVTSISASSTIHMVSTSLDRYFRIHTVVPPPSQTGSNLERRGGIIEKTYLTSVPTAVVWDQQTAAVDNTTSLEDDDDLWDKMKHVD